MPDIGEKGLKGFGRIWGKAGIFGGGYRRRVWGPPNAWSGEMPHPEVRSAKRNQKQDAHVAPAKERAQKQELSREKGVVHTEIFAGL